jgi:hypothetical protein
MITIDDSAQEGEEVAKEVETHSVLGKQRVLNDL